LNPEIQFQILNTIPIEKIKESERVVSDDKDLESFDSMYELMFYNLLEGANRDLLPYGFVDDFVLKLRFLKIMFDKKE